VEGELQRALGRNLRAWRLEHGLSQEQLAEQWGWSRGYISELERGRRNASLQTVELLGRLTGSRPIDLLAS